MATRSVIAIRESNRIIGIYCHWDGDIDHNGKILLNNYSDETKLRKLIENGSISSLGPRIGTKHDFNNPPKDETTFYHRDRGEPINVMNFKNAQEMMDIMNDCEYFYLWENGNWSVSEGNEVNPLVNYL
nr:MAG: hypothetical protein [Caudoviricetes sp.]